uniref:Myb/SANT-like domain-containing protein n=1 Tax=Quercus lobata TaxID=97700 RepID=A0A7N2N439_QUELO
MMLAMEERSFSSAVEAIDLISAVKGLHGLSSLELHKLLRDSENFTIHYLNKKGSSIKILLDDVKVTEQLLDLVFYLLIVLGGYKQETRKDSMPLMHSAMVACSLYLLTGCICSQWPDLAHVLLAHPKVEFFINKTPSNTDLLPKTTRTGGKLPAPPLSYLQKIQLSLNYSKPVGCSCKLEDKGNNKIFVLCPQLWQRFSGCILTSECTNGALMGKNTTSNSEANKTRALWGDPSWTTTFCNLCAEEIEARDKGIFAALSAKGWSNLVIKVCDETGLNYDKEQLKCRWDVLKANWRVWNKLKGLDTNLGWDAMKETIDASDDWWDMKLKEVSKASKFRHKGLQNLQQLDRMFRNVATAGVDVFMDAAFGAVLVAIRFLDIKLSAQYPVSCMKSNLTAEQIELCEKGGVLFLVRAIFKLNVTPPFVESSRVVAAVSRRKAKVLSILLSLCESESLSYLDDVASSPGSLDLAKSVALEVFGLLKTELGRDPKHQTRTGDSERAADNLAASRTSGAFS